MRILIAGPSGSGKTTFAARLGRLLNIPHTEMDSLHWGPDWTPRPSFEADVQTLIERPAWITEWQYPQVRGRLLERRTSFCVPCSCAACSEAAASKSAASRPAAANGIERDV